MHTGFNRAIFAATPISSLSRSLCIGRFSFLGTMSNTSMKSGDSIKSFKNGADNGRDQKFRAAAEDHSRQFITTEASYDEEYPSLSASINSEPKCKRRDRVDLGSSVEKKLESEQLDQASFAMSDPKDSDLPFIEQSFDICFRKATKQKPRKGSLHKMWVPKEQQIVANPFEEMGQVLGPGMVLLKNYIPISEQVNIVNKCRELGLGPGGFYRPGYKDGAKLRLFMMCLGLDWDPQTRAYAEIRRHDNVVPPGIPSHFSSVVAKALDDSHCLIKKDMDITNVDDMLPKMSPDLCIVNFYTTKGRLGLHQDRDESYDSLRKGLPVVSVSVGDSAEFLFGNQRDVDKADNILLESGDVLIFGGESRHIFHGVTNIVPRTAPLELLEKTGLRPGRLNLTFRKY
ncbi:DNA N(6)-methyladenine demethylase ALKBH1D-like [Primulina huaijiensis]|uniref:DNA N(6)-methyladenine demethylase ALKBH1D-like n=1 Tax=Primulina huaijiensis TaxID=1492673 RepID=UPI003CC74D5B